MATSIETGLPLFISTDNIIWLFQLFRAQLVKVYISLPVIIMENPSGLEENIEVLSADMLSLKQFKDEVARKGGERMEGWLEKVEKTEVEVDELQKELNEIKLGSKPSGLQAWHKINKKVIDHLRSVENLKETRNAMSVETLLRRPEMEKLKRFSHEELGSFTSDFSTQLGSDVFGNVYGGKLPDGVEVAVKVLIDEDATDEIFLAEVRTMAITSHPNIIKLFGFCFEQEMKALVYESMNVGLDKILYEKSPIVEWEKLYGIAVEVAKGISYLHDDCREQIIHHDIKASNVLLDSNFSPNLAGFGLVTLMDKNTSHFDLTETRGTPGYAAPEMWMPSSHVTYKCDVYSFGMMLFEVLGMRHNREGEHWFPKQAWEKFEKAQLEELVVECGIGEKDREKAKNLSVVALWCIQFAPRLRPSMSDVVKMLEKDIQVPTPPNPFIPSALSFTSVDIKEWHLQLEKNASSP